MTWEGPRICALIDAHREAIMVIDVAYVVEAVLVGLGATLLIDLWALFLRRAFSIPSLNYCLLGRCESREHSAR
jgi:hypothetical protein